MSLTPIDQNYTNIVLLGGAEPKLGRKAVVGPKALEHDLEEDFHRVVVELQVGEVCECEQ
jgi:hypothetical protein